jgi:hypothetical protein
MPLHNNNKLTWTREFASITLLPVLLDEPCSSLGTVARLLIGQWENLGSISGESADFSLYVCVQASCEVHHPASSPLDTRGCGGRDSSFGIATGWTAGVRFPAGIRFFCSPQYGVLGPTQPSIQWVPGALSQGVKLLGRETDRVFMSWFLID